MSVTDAQRAVLQGWLRRRTTAQASGRGSCWSAPRATRPWRCPAGCGSLRTRSAPGGAGSSSGVRTACVTTRCPVFPNATATTTSGPARPLSSPPSRSPPATGSLHRRHRAAEFKGFLVRLGPLTDWNEHPGPFVRTKSADEILDKSRPTTGHVLGQQRWTSRSFRPKGHAARGLTPYRGRESAPLRGGTG